MPAVVAAPANVFAAPGNAKRFGFPAPFAVVSTRWR
jgi:hypothetical protein